MQHSLINVRAGKYGDSALGVAGMPSTRTRVPSAVPLVLAGLLLLPAAVGSLGVAAPTAHADAIDDAFLAALQAKGIRYESPEKALIAANEVCSELDLGRAPSDVASDVMNNSNLSGYSAGYFVGASISAYCPKHAT